MGRNWLPPSKKCVVATELPLVTFSINKCYKHTATHKQKGVADEKRFWTVWNKMGLKETHKIYHNVCVSVCESTICNITHTMLSVVQHSMNTAHYENMHDTNQHCKHIHTAYSRSGLWMTCYLVISRKLRRVERSSRRLICLWHWLQKKSSASSLRKLWKQSGRGAGALERGKRREEEEEVVSDRQEGVHWGGTGHLWGCRGC